ncbi:hypothetical protein AAAT95_15355 [Hominifimenecus microfluidus]
MEWMTEENITENKKKTKSKKKAENKKKKEVIADVSSAETGF